MNPGHFYLSNEVPPFNPPHNTRKGWRKVNNEMHVIQTPKDKRNLHCQSENNGLETVYAMVQTTVSSHQETNEELRDGNDR